MSPEEFTEKLLAAVPTGVRSVILYGSAAAGDHVDGMSDYNILAVLEELDVSHLKAIAKPALEWCGHGNPPPLLFTPGRLRRSADTFPLELLDIRQTRKILHGTDIIEGLEFSRANLRLQVEHELKGALIQLRERYLVTGGKPREVVRLITESLSTFQVMFRGALRLYQETVPAEKFAAVAALSKIIAFDLEVFATATRLKSGDLSPGETEADALFSRYLHAIEIVVDTVDALDPDASYP